MLKNIFLAAIFISLTFPKAGFYWKRIPFTLANCLLFTSCLGFLWYSFSFRNFLRKQPVFAIGTLYLAYVFLCCIFGIIAGAGIESLIGLIVMAGYAMLFFVTFYLFNKRDILFLTGIITVSLIIVVVYGFLQVFLNPEIFSLPGLTELYGSPPAPVTILKDGWIQVIEGRAFSKNIIVGGGMTSRAVLGYKVFSTFHHGNLFGSHLAIFVPFLSAVALIPFSKKKLSLFFPLILSIIVLIFTSSRSAFFALGTGFTALWLFLSPGSRFKLFSLVTIAVLIFILIISLAVFFNYRITGIDPSEYLSYNFAPRYLELGQRLLLKEKYGSELDHKASLLRGVVKTVFRDRTLRDILFGNMFRKTSYYIFYNFYLWMIFEIGLIGFGLFLLFLGYIIVVSLFSLGSIKDMKLKAIAAGGLAGLAGGVMHNLLDAPFYYPPILANFWILAGVVMVSVKGND